MCERTPFHDFGRFRDHSSRCAKQCHWSPWALGLCLSLLFVPANPLQAQSEGKSEPLGSTMSLDQLGTRENAPKSAAEPVIPSFPVRAEPVPALKFRLWAPRYELEPGSAQVHFARALLMWQMNPSEFRQEVTNSLSEEEPPTMERRREMVQSLQNVYGELHTMALSEDNDYDLRLRDVRGPEMFFTLLPEIQAARDLARCLVHKNRVHLADDDILGSVETLRDGFRLAAFVGQGETLIQVLVGIAIEGVMLEEVAQLMQHPDAPNMYFAIATLPRPLVDARRSLEFELGTIHRVFPVLAEAETESYGEAYWNRAWAELGQDLQELSNNNADTAGNVALAFIGIASGDRAKQRLLESGVPAEQVTEMPRMRAVLYDASLEIRRMSDELAKGFLLPSQQGLPISGRQIQSISTWMQDGKANSAAATIAGLLFPAVEAAHTAFIRQEFMVRRLMTVEAICLHAEQHGGKLPKSLEHLSPAPALSNPFDGQPFTFNVKATPEGRLITLSAEVPESAKHLREFEFLLSLAP